MRTLRSEFDYFFCSEFFLDRSLFWLNTVFLHTCATCSKLPFDTSKSYVIGIGLVGYTNKFPWKEGQYHFFRGTYNSRTMVKNSYVKKNIVFFYKYNTLFDKINVCFHNFVRCVLPVRQAAELSEIENRLMTKTTLQINAIYTY